jgi:hypothetical protein
MQNLIFKILFRYILFLYSATNVQYGKGSETNTCHQRLLKS